jgi:hypothetical protein
MEVRTSVGHIVFFSKLHLPYSNFYDHIILVQKLVKCANLCMTLSNVCMYGHMYATEGILDGGSYMECSLVHKYQFWFCA